MLDPTKKAGDIRTPVDEIWHCKHRTDGECRSCPDRSYGKMEIEGESEWMTYGCSSAWFEQMHVLYLITKSMCALIEETWKMSQISSSCDVIILTPMTFPYLIKNEWRDVFLMHFCAELSVDTTSQLSFAVTKSMWTLQMLRLSFQPLALVLWQFFTLPKSISIKFWNLAAGIWLHSVKSLSLIHLWCCSSSRRCWMVLRSGLFAGQWNSLCFVQEGTIIFETVQDPSNFNKCLKHHCMLRDLSQLKLNHNLTHITRLEVHTFGW